MKIIALGDIHGRTVWKKILEKENYDKVIFMGDYFDSKENISAIKQIKNFHEILALKKLNPQKTVLLFGNHDFHYLPVAGESYTGFQPHHYVDISESVSNARNEHMLQMCFAHKQFLFSHAGVTKTWCKNNVVDMHNLQDSINGLFELKPSAFKFTTGNNLSYSRDDVTQSPVWVRHRSLMQNAIDGYIQVIGHTRQHTIVYNNIFYCIDTLDASNEYLVIENDIISIRRLAKFFA